MELARTPVSQDSTSRFVLSSCCECGQWDRGISVLMYEGNRVRIFWMQ